MVLDASLLNTQHYKVRIKGKVEQSREGVAPSPTHWCSSYRKGSLRATLDYGRQLYLLIAMVRKGCVGFYYERELETEHNWNILTPKLWPSTLCLSRFPGLLNRSPRVHSAGCWLSFFPYRISSFSISNSTQLCSLLFNSSALYYLQTPTWWYGHASTISSDIWRSGCVTSAIFGMACVIVIERK